MQLQVRDQIGLADICLQIFFKRDNLFLRGLVRVPVSDARKVAGQTINIE